MGTTPNQSQSLNKRRRAGIGEIISYLKSDYHAAQNYLYDQDSSQINATLAVATWNMRKWTGNGRQILSDLTKMVYAMFFHPLKSAS